MEVDLIADHSSLIISSIGMLSIYGLWESFQGPLHPSGEVEVDATDCCSTVYQSSGFSDFSVFCLVKGHRNGD